MDCKKFNNLRLITALTLFVLLINFISIAIFIRPVEADNFHEIRLNIANQVQAERSGKVTLSFIPQSPEIYGKGISISIPDGFSDLRLNNSNFKFFLNGENLYGKFNEYDPFVGIVEFVVEDQKLKNVENVEISFEIDSEMTNPPTPQDYSFNVRVIDLGEDKVFGGTDDLVTENGSVKLEIIKNDLVFLPEY